MTMEEFARDVDMTLESSIVPFTAGPGSGREGGLSGNDAPFFTPEEFVKQLWEKSGYYEADAWSLIREDTEARIARADKKYRSYYANWVKLELAADANPILRKWQADARKAAGV